jgi:hypothetical protein
VRELPLLVELPDVVGHRGTVPEARRRKLSALSVSILQRPPKEEKPLSSRVP